MTLNLLLATAIIDLVIALVNFLDWLLNR